MWIVPSSEAEAKRGRTGWKATDRRALVWYLMDQLALEAYSEHETYLNVLYGLLPKSISNHPSFLS